ncbi:hypothetical protein [Helicobacter sp. T3_23-1059]
MGAVAQAKSKIPQFVILRAMPELSQKILPTLVILKGVCAKYLKI